MLPNSRCCPRNPNRPRAGPAHSPGPRPSPAAAQDPSAPRDGDTAPLDRFNEPLGFCRGSGEAPGNGPGMAVAAPASQPAPGFPLCPTHGQPQSRERPEQGLVPAAIPEEEEEGDGPALASFPRPGPGGDDGQCAVSGPRDTGTGLSRPGAPGRASPRCPGPPCGGGCGLSRTGDTAWGTACGPFRGSFGDEGPSCKGKHRLRAALRTPVSAVGGMRGRGAGWAVPGTLLQAGMGQKVRPAGGDEDRGRGTV